MVSKFFISQIFNFFKKVLFWSPLFTPCLSTVGLPWWLSTREPTFQWRRCEFDPWVGKIPWRRARQPTPVFFCGESHGQRSPVSYSPGGHKESDMTQQLSTHIHTHTHTANICWESQSSEKIIQLAKNRVGPGARASWLPQSFAPCPVSPLLAFTVTERPQPKRKVNPSTIWWHGKGLSLYQRKKLYSFIFTYKPMSLIERDGGMEAILTRNAGLSISVDYGKMPLSGYLLIHQVNPVPPALIYLGLKFKKKN